MPGAVGLIELRPGGDREPEIASDPAAAIYTDWESVYQDNVVGIYQLAFRRVGNAADAEDVAEDVMIRTLKTLRFPAPVHNVRSYLVKTAKTVLADHWRSHYAAQNVALELEQLPPEGSAGPSNTVASERAQRLLAMLPDQSRRVLELRFLLGYSVREAAKAMGVTESNARVLQFRALRKAAELEREVLG
jgi:RNA polymerase sigma-70 factor (ECF subfamily)